MRMPSIISLPAMAIIALAIGSCSSAPEAPAPAPTAAAKPAPEPAKAPEKVAKQRTIVTKVPVLVKESAFYVDGLPDETVVYKLDAAQRLTLEKVRFDPSRSEPVQRVAYEYKEGRLWAESSYESDGKLRSRREFSYDSAGRLAGDRVLDPSGKALSSSAYAYDGNGRKSEWKAMDGAGGVNADTTYAYGPDGLSLVEMRDSGGALAGSIRLEYAAGKLAKRSYFGPDGAPQKVESFAYAGGRIQSVELRRADGGFVSKTAYAYGSSGELVRETSLDASGKDGSYRSYEYAVREDGSVETYYE
jgi:hypothetical protein